MSDQPSNLKPQQKQALRFSLRSMLTAMTAFAVWCGLVSILPMAFSQMLVGLVWILATGWLVTGLFFAVGDQKAFCIGAAIVVSSTWTRIGARFLQGVYELAGLFFGGIAFSRSVSLWIDLLLIAGVAVANGFFCIHARRYFEIQSTEV